MNSIQLQPYKDYRQKTLDDMFPERRIIAQGRRKTDKPLTIWAKLELLAGGFVCGFVLFWFIEALTAVY